ncbi:hypothetical protein PSHT_11987 [Puccinia striiformis]|uniref:Uncharacterized protein n=2 Tax=Puccinia striiformis TaxID=27350 RepID=A0A2S4UE95_9BASI|nr:hypothetical protein PSTT_16213 [Puccinia striiformis]POW02749.1 hypothetical protein PSHT_11987 [Puccinia striiformis]
MLFLPRALAVRKSASSTANRPIAPPTGPNPPISGTNRKPTESEIIAGPSVTLSSNCQDTLIGPTHAVPTPKYYTSVSGHPSNTDPSYQHHVSDSAPQRIDVAQSLHSGCIVWLNGLPINQKITKPVISNLVGAIHNSANGPVPSEVETSEETHTDEPAKHSDVKYVDFTKGLANCHIRFSSAPSAAQFVNVLKSFSGSQNPSILVISGLEIDCAKLDALVINGRRQDIYLERIPDYLH